MDGFNKAELIGVMDEHSDAFAKALKKQVEGWESPLRFQIPATENSEVNLNEIPAFQEWLTSVAIQSSLHGVVAFIDVLTMDSPNTSTLESLQKDNETLRLRLKDAYLYIQQLGGTIHPTDWPEYNSEDTLPWSTSPQ